MSGCGGGGLSRDVYDSVQVGRSLEEVSQQIPEPGRGVQLLKYYDRWVYLDEDRDVRMAIFFDAEKIITSKQWWENGRVVRQQP